MASAARGSDGGSMADLSPTQQQTAYVLTAMAAAYRAAAIAVGSEAEHPDPTLAAAHEAMADVLEEYQEAVGMDVPIPLPSSRRGQPDGMYDPVTGGWCDGGEPHEA